MNTITKKSGQKIKKRLERFSRIANREGKKHIDRNITSRISHVKDVRLHIIEWTLIIVIIILFSITQSLWYSNSYMLTSYGKGGIFTEGTLGKVNSLNPLFATTNSEKAISKLMFATLSENDYSGHPGLGLAESIKYDESGKIWTVKLRENLKWSDDELITNDDIIFTINLIKNKSVITSYSSNLSGVEVAEDESGNLVFTLPASYVDFETALNFPILPKHCLENTDPEKLLESDYSKNPVVSGAYKFNASQPVGSEGENIIYLLSNKNFYKGEPNIRSFGVHAFLDKEAILEALNSGTIVATAELSSQDEGRIKNNKIAKREAVINSGVFAFINTKSLSSKSLRQAIQQGIDLEKIREISVSGLDLDHPILHSQIEIQEEQWLEKPKYDIEKAKAILSESSFDISQQILVVSTNDETTKNVAENFVSQLNDLGLNAILESYEQSQDFNYNIINKRNYDILVYEVDLGAAPDLFSYYHSTQINSGLNLSNYGNTLVNDLILAARETTNLELRNAKYSSILGYLTTDVPSIPFYQTNMTYYYNKNVQIFSENIKLVEPIDRFVEIEQWATEKTFLNRTP